MHGCTAITRKLTSRPRVQFAMVTQVEVAVLQPRKLQVQYVVAEGIKRGAFHQENLATGISQAGIGTHQHFRITKPPCVGLSRCGELDVVGQVGYADKVGLAVARSDLSGPGDGLWFHSRDRADDVTSGLGWKGSCHCYLWSNLVHSWCQDLSHRGRSSLNA